MKVSAVVMASGMSKRMKAEKLRMIVGNKPMYMHVLEKVSQCDFYDTAVVSWDHEILKSASELGFKGVKNPEYDRGQSKSVVLGLKNLEQSDGYMFFVADQPLLTAETIKELLRTFENNPQKIVMPVCKGRRGNPVIFPEALKGQLLSLEGDTGGKAVISSNSGSVLTVEIKSEQELLDIDTAEDYERLASKVHMNKDMVIIKGGGDIATGVVQKLHRCGFRVLILEVEKPTAIRRAVSLSEAIFRGHKAVEDIVCVRAESIEEIYKAWQEDKVAAVVDPEGAYIKKLKPKIVVDCIIAKKNTGMSRDLAPITIAVGPGFTAGSDVDAVVESNRGHNLGRIYFEGEAEPNTQIPGIVKGLSMERVLYSPCGGIFSTSLEIGDRVKKGDVVGETGGMIVRAKIDGIIRGLLRDGTKVTSNFKIGDVDPREDEYENCFTISDKARAIGGGVLEAAEILKRIKNI
ncbi:MAG: selenium-dependent molybdenum cofactor biosynthesis protein YqeB [Sedimentibacter sp.]|uniref:selenium-dependent molybdenum cofactor biosynthesis protein YqeB n=1 Tax=Sedimentibacter sp. TaxID=1960295 RepID=UPI00315918C2